MNGPDLSDDAEQKRLDLIHNERTKLTATYLNGAAIAIFAVGGFAPVVSVFNSATPASSVGSAILVLVCLPASGALHLVARRILGRMK